MAFENDDFETPEEIAARKKLRQQEENKNSLAMIEPQDAGFYLQRRVIRTGNLVKVCPCGYSGNDIKRRCMDIFTLFRQKVEIGFELGGYSFNRRTYDYKAFIYDEHSHFLSDCKEYGADVKDVDVDVLKSFVDEDDENIRKFYDTLFAFSSHSGDAGYQCSVFVPVDDSCSSYRFLGVFALDFTSSAIERKVIFRKEYDFLQLPIDSRDNYYANLMSD